MSFVARFMGNTENDDAPAGAHARPLDSLTDGAIDTLSSVIRVMGDESFPVDGQMEPDAFVEICREYASHVANGTPVASAGIEACAQGVRQWAMVRQFYADRRKAEKAFVSERLNDYRSVVGDLVSGLRSIGERDQETESTVIQNLKNIEDAIGRGLMPEIREALSDTFERVSETFAEQKRHYESQLSELNERMLNLRQDLVAAREEMKRDSLTGAYNRRAFDASILQSLNTRFILNQAATLALIDLDNFKEINDRYGHAAGDEVLRQVGECLARAFIRKGDFVSRYGGDEFAVILNDTSAANSTKLVERFLGFVREVRIPDAPDEAIASCSIGYTELETTDCVKTAVERADEALYVAKKEGRNRAVLGPPIPA